MRKTILLCGSFLCFTLMFGGANAMMEESYNKMGCEPLIGRLVDELNAKKLQPMDLLGIAESWSVANHGSGLPPQMIVEHALVRAGLSPDLHSSCAPSTLTTAGPCDSSPSSACGGSSSKDPFVSLVKGGCPAGAGSNSDILAHSDSEPKNTISLIEQTLPVARYTTCVWDEFTKLFSEDMAALARSNPAVLGFVKTPELVNVTGDHVRQWATKYKKASEQELKHNNLIVIDKISNNLQNTGHIDTRLEPPIDYTRGQRCNRTEAGEHFRERNYSAIPTLDKFVLVIAPDAKGWYDTNGHRKDREQELDRLISEKTTKWCKTNGGTITAIVRRIKSSIGLK